MFHSLRTFIAGTALAISALLVTSGFQPETIGVHAPLLMFLVFVHAWVIAVGERATVTAGGMRTPRFPLGGRVLCAKPPVILSLFLFAVLAGFVTGTWGPSYVQPNLVVLGVGLLVATILGFEVLRRWSKILIPAALAVHALVTMREFYTLGNLVDTASGWLQMVVTGFIAAVILAGPLIRTDVAGKMPGGARFFVLLASLPAYLGGFWIGDLGWMGLALDKMSRIGIALLAGGLAQTLLVGLVLPVFGQGDREHSDIPLVHGKNIGLALLPMLLPLGVWMMLQYVVAAPAGSTEQWLSDTAAVTSQIPQDVWLGLFVFLSIIPLLIGATMVASGLDRLDGHGGRTVGFLGMGALAGWFLVGPECFALLLAPDGPLVGLGSALGVSGAAQGLIADRSGFSLLPATPLLAGNDVAILGVPIADYCRLTTLMIGTSATLSLRYLGYGRPRVRGMGWHLPLMLVLVFVGSSWFAAPYLGVLGPLVAATVTAALMLIIDVVIGQPAPEDDPRVLGQVAPQTGH